jgi:hypothetical protein
MPMKKISSQLPDDLYQQVKMSALQRGLKVQEFLTVAIQNTLMPEAQSPEEPFLTAVQKILRSKNTLAIENIATAINASMSLLRMTGTRQPDYIPIIPIPVSSNADAKVNAAQPKRAKKVG